MLLRELCDGRLHVRQGLIPAFLTFDGLQHWSRRKVDLPALGSGPDERMCARSDPPPALAPLPLLDPRAHEVRTTSGGRRGPPALTGDRPSATIWTFRERRGA